MGITLKFYEKKNHLNKCKEVNPSDFFFWCFFILIFCLGLFLRLYQVTDQIILDDEWHGLDFTINNSLWYLLTHFTYAGANCIPLNLYIRLLYEYIGWSEISLILPSIISGLTSLFIFPLLVKKIFNSRVSLIFMFLFAISPLVVFYGRVCRPYSVYTFFGFLSIILLYFWTLNNKKLFFFLYAVTGILCVYFHLMGAVFVFIPIGCVLFLKLLKDKKIISQNKVIVAPGYFNLIFLGLITLFSILLLFYWPYIQRLSFLNQQKAEFDLGSLTGFFHIVCGTSNNLICIILWVFFIIGLILMLRKNLLLGAIFTSVFFFYFGVLIIARSNFTEVPLVMARYFIPGFPIVFLCVAFGMDRLISISARIFLLKYKVSCFICLTGIFFLAGLFWAGPFKQVYVKPNNFMNHSAFQESYEPMNWGTPKKSHVFQKRYAVTEQNISNFYKQLALQKDSSKIIEFPMYLGNHFNLFYYYQHFHKKEVAIGYIPLIKNFQNERSMGFIYGNMTVDQVFSKVNKQEKLRFKNLINLLNFEDIKESHSDYVVFHKRPMNEMFLKAPIHSDYENMISVLSNVYSEYCGQPFFEDINLIVFKISDCLFGKRN